MNDEVKLILTKLKIVSEEKENGAYICDKEHSKLLLSYIEQLEKKVDQYENPEDLTLFHMWLDTRAKDKMKQLEKDKKELKDGWQQEIYDKNKVLSDWLEAERKINILENNRDKAIEYINENWGHWCSNHYKYATETIDILKGDSDNE